MVLDVAAFGQLGVVFGRSLLLGDFGLTPWMKTSIGRLCLMFCLEPPIRTKRLGQLRDKSPNRRLEPRPKSPLPNPLHEKIGLLPLPKSPCLMPQLISPHGPLDLWLQPKLSGSDLAWCPVSEEVASSSHLGLCQVRNQSLNLGSVGPRHVGLQVGSFGLLYAGLHATRSARHDFGLISMCCHSYCLFSFVNFFSSVLVCS